MVTVLTIVWMSSPWHDTMVSSFLPEYPTTHEMQLFDTAVFGPFESKWQEAYHQYVPKNAGWIITQYTFNVIAWLNSLVPSNIVSGFKTCGAYSRP